MVTTDQRALSKKKTERVQANMHHAVNQGWEKTRLRFIAAHQHGAVAVLPVPNGQIGASISEGHMKNKDSNQILIISYGFHSL